MDKNTCLKQTVNHLIVNAGYMVDSGLYHGKMGVILFLVHYARYTKESLYEDFAGELMDELYEDLHAGTPLDWENGLSGIGWGILYLLKNGFMEGEPDEVLCDIDQRLLEVNLRYVKDLSLERGLRGYAGYLFERFSTYGKGNVFTQEYMDDFHQLIKEREVLKESFQLSDIVKVDLSKPLSEWVETDLGLCEGYAGYGLKLLQEDETHLSVE